MVNLAEISSRGSRLLPLAVSAPQAGQRIREAIKIFEYLVDPRRALFGTRSHHRDHWQRMLVNSQALPCQQLGIDLPLLQIAVILHDVGVFYSQDPVHGWVSAAKIRPHLAGMGLTINERNKVCSIVQAHDGQNYLDNSVEAQALRALDALDAFGEIGVFRYFEIYYRRGLRPPEIFTRAFQGIENKRRHIPDNWFGPEQLARINAAFTRARGIFARACGELDGGALSLGVAGIIDDFLSIDWDLNRLPELANHDTQSPRSGFVRQYFADLRLAWLAWQIK